MALYRDNFCACKDGECKIGLQNHFRRLMKQDFSHCEETITNMISVLQGSSHSPKQINILVSLLKKLTIEQYSHQKMDQILDLFVVLYLKCSRDVQLTFLDDIDKMYLMIIESQQQIFVERKFQ